VRSRSATRTVAKSRPAGTIPIHCEQHYSCLLPFS
jgi:hypothetical protein